MSPLHYEDSEWGGMVCSAEHPPIVTMDREYARRIVASVNALSGYNVETLEDYCRRGEGASTYIELVVGGVLK